MALSQQLVAPLSGLARNVNRIIATPGSLVKAHNVCVIENGTLQPLPETVNGSILDTSTTDENSNPITLENGYIYATFDDFSLNLALSYGTRVQVAAVGSSPSFNTSVETNEETLIGFVGVNYLNTGATYCILRAPLFTIQPLPQRRLGFIPGATRCVTTQGRSFMTEKWGVIVGGGFRFAGLPPPPGPRLYTSSSPGNNSLWLPPDNIVKYKYTIVIKKVDNNVYKTPTYEVESPPSPMAAIRNVGGSNIAPYVTCWVDGDTTFAGWPSMMHWGQTTTSFENRYIRVYRSKMRDGTFAVDEVEDDYRLVGEFPVTGTNMRLEFVDGTTDEARAAGANLYTAAEGESSGNFPPPASTDVCLFKGTLFFTNRAQLNSLELKVKGAFGLVNLGTTTELGSGIGRRAFTFSSAPNGTNNVTIQNITADDLFAGLQVGQFISWLWTDSQRYTGYITAISGSGSTRTLTLDTTTRNEATPNTVEIDDVLFVRPTYSDGTVGTVASYPIPFHMRHCPYVSVFTSDVERHEATHGGKVLVMYTGDAAKRVRYFEVGGTNGSNYTPAIPSSFPSTAISIGDRRTHRVFFSKAQLPESVPLTNYFDVGGAGVLKLVPADDCIYAFCRDGLFRIRYDGTNVEVEELDTSVIPISADCAVRLDGVTYALCTRGLVAIVGDQVTELSNLVLSPIDRQALLRSISPSSSYSAIEAGGAVTADPFSSHILIHPRSVDRTSPVYRWDAKTNALTTQDRRYDATMSGRTGMMSGAYRASLNSGQIFFRRPADQGTLTSAPSYPIAYMPVDIEFNPLLGDSSGATHEFRDIFALIEAYEDENGLIRSADGRTISFYFVTRDGIGDPLSRPLTELNKQPHMFVPRRASVDFELRPKIITDGGWFRLRGLYINYRPASYEWKA